MKVLHNNYKANDEVESALATKIQPYPRTHICETCRSELEYEKADLRVGALGAIFLDCPLCHAENILDAHEDSITLTMDNIEFPTHFWHTSKENGAVDCCTNEEIKECINRAINYFRKNKDEFAWMTATGNRYVIVFRYDGDECYEVVVTKDYYNTYIEFEDKDYKVVI